MALSYLPRAEWGAVKPMRWNSLQVPVSRVYHMSTNTKTCSDELSCIRICQRLQARHLEKGFGDIRYSFVIGGDGQVYEGRGWKHAPRLPKDYMDRNQINSVLIGFIGRWVNNALPSLMIRASSDLVDYGIDNNFLRRDYRSEDLFHDEFKERVVAEIIRESTINRHNRRMRTANMMKAMGLSNELSPEIDTNYMFKKR